MLLFSKPLTTLNRSYSTQDSDSVFFRTTRRHICLYASSLKDSSFTYFNNYVNYFNFLELPDYRFSVDGGSWPFIFMDFKALRHLLLNGLSEPPSPQKLPASRLGFTASTGLGNPESPISIQATGAYNSPQHKTTQKSMNTGPTNNYEG
jgi:hypothetical protein